MKKIDKLILKAFFGPFLVTTSVVLFIFLMRFILTYFDEFVGKDLGFFVFVELFSYFTLIMVPTSLPLAVLLASLMCYGNLGEFFELTAIKSAGISIERALRPIFFISILVAACSFWFSNTVLPWANLKGWSLMWDVKTKKATLNLKEGIFYYDLPGYSIKVNKKYADGRSLKGMVVYDHSENNGNRRVILADSGQMYTMLNNRYLVFELFNGCDYLEFTDKTTTQANETKFVRNGFLKSKLVFDLSSFDMKNTEEEQFKHHQSMKNVTQLSKMSDSLRNDLQSSRNNQFLTAKQYYTFHLRDVVDTGAVAKIKTGRWVDSLLKKNLREHRMRVEVVTTALSQARNMQTSVESYRTYLRDKEKEQARTDLEFHRKFTQAIACIILFLIGAPLGSIIKRGGFGMPVLVSIIFFILMYVFTLNGEKWAKEGFTTSLFGAWFANGMLLLFGLYFLSKARNDSRLFEADAYAVYWNRLKTYLKVKFKEAKINRKKTPQVG